MNTLDKYRNKIESSLERALEEFNGNPIIKKACTYALLNGGKRFRPAIAMMVAEAINPQIDVSQVALTIEYFHTASLIADDLPCMDNDDTRRDKPSLHKIYGETIALLATYALIAEGYRNLYLNAQYLKIKKKSNQSDQICSLALENATFNTGVSGATGGQVLDLTASDLSLESIKKIIHQKTTSLFEIAFVFGWLYGGGSFDQLNEIKDAAKHFGLAYQISDDLLDQDTDKTNGRMINIANLFGKDFAIELLEEELNNYLQKIDSLGIATTELLSLSELIKNELFSHYGNNKVL